MPPTLSPTKFVILAHPRTGSYNLVSLLDSASDISCYGELFKARRIELPQWRRDKIGFQLPEERDANVPGFLEAVQRLTPRKHFGFKVFPQHLRDAQGLEAALSDYKWICLLRDPLETYASIRRATLTQIWTNREGANVDEMKLNARVQFTPESLHRFLGSYRALLKHCERRLHQNGGFVLRYDQIGEPRAMKALLEHVGSDADPETLQSTYRKQFSGTLSEGFENWDELQDYIARHDPLPALPATSVATD